MKPYVPIDWAAVRQAQRRGKEGRMRPGDDELCVRAYHADPERYTKSKREVDAEVIKEQQSILKDHGRSR